MSGSGIKARLLGFARAGGGTAVIAMAARVSGQFAMIAVTLVATRHLAPADFGVFAIAGALVMLARTMLYTGPFEYLLKLSHDADQRRGAGACLAATVLVALVWIALLVMLGLAAPFVFKGGGVAPVILALAPSVLLGALAAFAESLMLRSGTVRRYYAITVLAEVGAGIAAIALLASGWGLWALVLQIYARTLLMALALGALGPPLALAAPPRALVAEVLRWSVSRFGSVLVSFLANYSGDLVLGMVFSPAASGLYRAANRMVTALADMFVQPAGMLALTTLASGRARGEGEGLPGAWPRLAALFAVLGWPALALLALFAHRVVPLALGPAWAAAAPVVAVFCVARMAALVTAVATAELIVTDRQGRVLAIQTFAAAATAGLTLLAAPYGALGAAVAATFVALFAAVAMALAALQRRDRPALAEAARLVIFPLVGAFVAGLAADRAFGTSTPLVALALPLACAAAGWLLAAWPVIPALRRAVALLTEVPKPA
ncbi:oligosaccharide flippase family protein [Novosphingobium sp.]|uniref:oligosaccharide flippase family protein n=1 Tax=Novosphingobium sp. TaxID=1874826 RepID=UPI002638D597|nr:oligosaccharide flippase family protein [Novosphingobium sp.]